MGLAISGRVLLLLAGSICKLRKRSVGETCTCGAARSGSLIDPDAASLACSGLCRRDAGSGLCRGSGKHRGPCRGLLDGRCASVTPFSSTLVLAALARVRLIRLRQ